MELFQDEEKARSPTGAVPATGGRTRLSVKPDKNKAGQASKEHKKTVGLQVEDCSRPNLFSLLLNIFYKHQQWIRLK